MPAKSNVIEKAEPLLTGHGAIVLPTVAVNSYNVELKDDEGFLGDRANKGAFREIITNWRKLLKKDDEDPFKEPTEEVSKKKLDEALLKGNPKAAGIVIAAIEEFSQEFALVIRRILKLKEWRDTECLTVGGGFRDSRIGEIVIGRANMILKAADVKVELIPIRQKADDAALIGPIHLAPPWVFAGFDAILTVDIGGTNIRAGVVELLSKKTTDVSKAKIWKALVWKHGEEKKVSRQKAIERLTDMIDRLMQEASQKQLRLAPLIGIGCPGVITESGHIDRGAQNLPGNWSHKDFNLPDAIKRQIPLIDQHGTTVVMHNDAVTQGLSQTPFMQQFKQWGVLTIGTGLGNAVFTNRSIA